MYFLRYGREFNTKCILMTSSSCYRRVQIFGHLHPLDLLHLARTTKPFRRVLMSRSAISVWKDARSKIVGMPECRPSTSEPAYANLAFDFHCHVCAILSHRSYFISIRASRRIVSPPMFETSNGDLACGTALNALKSGKLHFQNLMSRSSGTYKRCQ